MRLIDADDFFERMENDTDICAEMEKDGLEALKKYLDIQPTAYDVDKVVEQLETARDGYSTAQLMTATNDELVKRFIAKEKALKLAINIVNAGGTDDVL